MKNKCDVCHRNKMSSKLLFTTPFDSDDGTKDQKIIYLCKKCRKAYIGQWVEKLIVTIKKEKTFCGVCDALLVDDAEKYFGVCNDCDIDSIKFK